MNIERRIFNFLLSLYPHDHNKQFGQEMAELFELRMMATPNRARFLISEAAGLLAGAVREWFARRKEPPYVPMGDPDLKHLPREVVTSRLRVNSAVQKMVYAISHHQFEQARRLAVEERIERENLRRLCENYGIDAI
jgi:hypothetical protein